MPDTYNSFAAGPLSRRGFLGAGISLAGATATAVPATAAAEETTFASPGAGTPSSPAPLAVSGVIPRLAVSASLKGPRSESGIGALMPWGGRLWFITYTSHTSTTGSGTGLFWVDDSFAVHKHAASVVGTYACRLVHAPSEQMIIGPHVTDADNNVRTMDDLAGYRLTAAMTHLHDPKNKIYILGMESHLFEVDLRTLKATLLFTLNEDLRLPAGSKPHYKGGFTAGDRLVVANNTYHERDETEGVSTGGRLAEWNGQGDWRILESTAFCDVAGTPMGDHANVFAAGWDRASVILAVLNRGRWSRYRLPKASRTHDQAWYTEWPRIREVETERFLMDIHGMFYELPRLAYGGRVWGIQPICRHLRVVPDFCSWRGMLVLAGNQATACTGSYLVGEPQANLWFGKTDDLWSFGRPQGWGGVWQQTPVRAGQASDPFLMTGFERMGLHLTHDSGDEVGFTVEIDFLGNGTWKSYDTLAVKPGAYVHHEFPAGFGAQWVRLTAKGQCAATAHFVCAG